MSSTVYLADLRTGNRENLHTKLVRLLETAGIEQIVGRGDLAAIKVHFGEKGGHAYIRPTFLRRIVDKVKTAGGRPFLTDSCTHPAARSRLGMTCGIGSFALPSPARRRSWPSLRGHAAKRVKITGEVLKTVDIALGILEDDVLIAVSHFKCHELTGFGGTLKNLGMGCSSRAGKMQQHSPSPRRSRSSPAAACSNHAPMTRLFEGTARSIPMTASAAAAASPPAKRQSTSVERSASLVMKRWPNTPSGCGRQGGQGPLRQFHYRFPSPATTWPPDAPIVPDLASSPLSIRSPRPGLRRSGQ
jgi:uncharacterized Fe-S center protein